MTAGTHILAAVVLASALKLPLLPAVIGAIVPDLDLKKGLPFPPKRNLLNSHRGITHHLALVPVLLLVSITVKDFLSFSIGIYLLSFSVGYGSHLLLDALTPLGIPYKLKYYPRLSLKLFKTGTLGEVFVILVMVMLLILEVKKGLLSFNSLLGEEITKTVKEVTGEVLH
jgi:inner membrane protein